MEAFVTVIQPVKLEVDDTTEKVEKFYCWLYPEFVYIIVLLIKKIN